MSLTRWISVASLVALAPCQAQNAMSSADTSSPPPAAAADVHSMDAIMHAIYDVISGPAAQPRDWNRFYSLFAPGARLIPTRRAAPDSTPHVLAMTPQQFAERGQAYFDKNAFYEHEISHSVDTFGAITQIFSTYESKHAATDAKPFARGINSFQLFNDGKRWYVVTIYWDDEHAGNPIPARYLTASAAHSK